MEYAYNDYCIGTLAKALNKEEDANELFKRSKNWKNLWNTNVTSLGNKKKIVLLL